jgi:acetyl-CoA carboxylase carboxyltransferase component
MLYAPCEATVPKITVVMGKNLGGAYLSLAWPTARVAEYGRY